MMLALIAGVISEVSMPSLVAAAVSGELTVALADLSTGEEWVCGRSLQEEDTGA